MNVGWIVPGFSANDDDWCIPALLDLARTLSPHVDLRIVTLRYPHLRGAYRAAGADVFAIGGAMADGAAKGPLLARAFGHVVRDARRRPFHVLHGLWADEPGAIAVAAARRLRVPSVVSLMGGELVGLADIDYGVQLGAVGRRLVRFALRRATLVTAGSQDLAHRARAFGVQDARIAASPLGVDCDRFRPRDAAPAMEATGTASPVSPAPVLQGSPRLLHVASLSPVKNQATLLRAMAIVVAQQPSAHLHIVGDGPMRDAVTDLVSTLRLQSHVTLHGAVAHDWTPAFYRAADIFLLTSIVESQSVAALEAAASGLPIVGAAVGVLPELGDACVTVRVNDAAELARAILDVWSDRIRCERMGREARRTALARFSLADRTADLRRLYERVV